MLPKGRKLTRKVFPRHTDANTTWNGEVLRIRAYIKTTPEAHARFAVVVSKKQYSSTADRNLFKRRVFAALLPHLSSFDRLRFGKYVIFPKNSVDTISYTQITRDIEEFVARCS